MIENPLSPQQIQELRDLQRRIPAIRAEMKKAKAAGIPMDKQLSDLDEQETQLNQLLQHYG